METKEQWIVKLAVLAVLALNTWSDLRKREILPLSLVVFGLGGCLQMVYLEDAAWKTILGGVVIGSVFLTFAAFSRGSMGWGDGLLICVTGVYLGLQKNLVLVLGALFLSAVYSAGLFLFKKASRKQTIPFVPFLLLSFIGGLILEG